MNGKEERAKDVSRSNQERLLVCVGPSPSSAGLIEYAGKTASSLHAKWCAVYVDHPAMLAGPAANRNRAIENLRLAESLGAETFTLDGRSVAEEIAGFAREKKITRILVGKPGRSSWISGLAGNPVDRLLRMSGGIDVLVTSGDPGEKREAVPSPRPKAIDLADYGTSLLFLIVATALCFGMYTHFDLSNLIMVYLLGVMLTATSCGRGPAILNSALSVLAFDFFFVPPRFTFTVDDAQYIVTFIVMFLVAFVISHLAAGMRQQAAAARLQEHQAAAMHGLSGQLTRIRGVENILKTAIQYISEILDCQAVALLPDEKGKLRLAAGDPSSVLEKDIVKEMQAAGSAYRTGRMAGRETQDSPTAENLYAPLQAADVTLGVLALRPADPERFREPERLHLLESLAKQVALALEVERLTEGGAGRQ